MTTSSLVWQLGHFIVLLSNVSAKVGWRLPASR
jgi:hypothetical protein